MLCGPEPSPIDQAGVLPSHQVRKNSRWLGHCAWALSQLSVSSQCYGWGAPEFPARAIRDSPAPPLLVEWAPHPASSACTRSRRTAVLRAQY